MTNELPELASDIEYVGPFETINVVIGGYQVPFLTAEMLPRGTVTLILDHRMAADFSVGIADDVARFVADAIAIAMGYGCHPRQEYGGPVLRTPFPQVHEITSIHTEEIGDGE